MSPVPFYCGARGVLREEQSRYMVEIVEVSLYNLVQLIYSVELKTVNTTSDKE